MLPGTLSESVRYVLSQATVVASKDSCCYLYEGRVSWKRYLSLRKWLTRVGASECGKTLCYLPSKDFGLTLRAEANGMDENYIVMRATVANN